MNITYLGNHDLINLPKTAFLASSTIPTEKVLECYDWATKMSKGTRCMMSGFSSHLEKNVLRMLLKGRCPIIIVLARQMYRNIPKELQLHIDNGRLLIISTSLAPRQSKATAFARNRYICEQADDVIFICSSQTSSLCSLYHKYKDKATHFT